MGSKEDILTSALRLFLQKGYERTSINDIVKESNFTKGGIYHYYENKDKIFFEAVSQLFENIEQKSNEVLTSANSVREIIETYFSVLGNMKNFLNEISNTENIAEYNYYTLMFEAMQKSPEIKASYFENHRIFLSQFAEKLAEAQSNNIIRNDIDCETLAFEIHALIEGSFLYSIFDETLDLKEMGKKMFRNLWTSISVKE